MSALPPITQAFPLNSHALAEAAEMVELAASLSKVKDRHGGYFFVLAPDGDGYCSVVGQILDESKRDRYRALAEEKARRVASHPKHRTSFESLDKAKEHFQGAIKCPGGACIGFAGRPPDESEAICLMFALARGLLIPDEAKEIAKISGNTFFWLMFGHGD